MNTEELLKQIGKVVEGKIRASEKRVKAELEQVILDSQEDTINALKEYIEESYNVHEKWIERLEEHTGLIKN